MFRWVLERHRDVTNLLYSKSTASSYCQVNSYVIPTFMGDLVKMMNDFIEVVIDFAHLEIQKYRLSWISLIRLWSNIRLLNPSTNSSTIIMPPDHQFILFALFSWIIKICLKFTSNRKARTCKPLVWFTASSNVLYFEL